MEKGDKSILSINSEKMNTTAEKQNFFLKVSTFLNLWRLRKTKNKKKLKKFCLSVVVFLSKYQNIKKFVKS